MPAPHSLDSFFRPRSVAVIGASSTPTKIGGVPVAYFKRLGFKGPIYPVNTQQSEIQELKAHPTVSAIGQPVDLAVVAVPAVGVLNALADAAKAGVKAVVLFSSGFAEVGEEGARMQAKLTELSRQSGMRCERRLCHLQPGCQHWDRAARQRWSRQPVRCVRRLRLFAGARTRCRFEPLDHHRQ
jgi:predicted CoA-binding protein